MVGMPDKTRGRSVILNNVNVLRLISTYLLVVYHGRPALLSAGVNDQTVGALRAGTDLFLVCSAFLTIHTNAAGELTATSFLGKRVIRIVPLYWFITIAVFILSAMVPSLFQATRADFSELVKSLLFIPYEKRNHAIQPMVFVAWTLNYIMFFSVIYAASIAAVGSRLAWTLTTGIILSLILIGEIYTFQDAALRFYTSPILADFLYGMLLSKLYNHRRSILKLPPFSPHEIVYVLVAATITLTMIVAQPYHWSFVHRSLSLGIPCAVLLALAIRAEAIGFKIEDPWLKTLSKFTFSIYLSHFFCTGVLGAFTNRYGPLSYEQLALGLAATLVAATILGGALFYWVEEPITRALKSRARVATGDQRRVADFDAHHRPGHAGADQHDGRLRELDREEVVRR